MTPSSTGESALVDPNSTILRVEPHRQAGPMTARSTVRLLVAAVGVAAAACGGDGTGPAPYAGVIAYDFRDDIYVRDLAQGTVHRLTTDSTNVSPAWSPDGSRIAFVSSRDGSTDIWVMNADGTEPRNITNTSSTVLSDPAWSPDGTKLAFSHYAYSGTYDIVVANVDGSGMGHVTTMGTDESSPAWSPDGTRIAFSTSPQRWSNIVVIDADGANPRNVTNDGGGNWYYDPTWSPDGARIAFSSSRTSRMEIWTTRVDGTDFVQLTRDNQDKLCPRWSPDGRMIMYVRIEYPVGTARRFHQYLIGADSAGLPTYIGPGGCAAWHPGQPHTALFDRR